MTTVNEGCERLMVREAGVSSGGWEGGEEGRKGKHERLDRHEGPGQGMRVKRRPRGDGMVTTTL